MLDQLIKEPFPGFDPKALKFLKQLSSPKYNNKEWFDKNRHTYEEYVKQPMRDLIDNLAVEIGKIDRNIIVSYKSIFRINRDIRFSKIKTPYKNYSSAAFAFDRIKSSEIPQFYFHFGPSEFIVAGGQYSSDPEYIKKIRAAVCKNFNEFKSIITDKKFLKAYKGIEGQSLTSMPRGYDNIDIKKADPLLIDTLKKKQFYVWVNYKPEKVLSGKIVDIILENIELMYDFMKFLHKATK